MQIAVKINRLCHLIPGAVQPNSSDFGHLFQVYTARSSTVASRRPEATAAEPHHQWQCAAPAPECARRLRSDSAVRTEQPRPLVVRQPQRLRNRRLRLVCVLLTRIRQARGPFQDWMDAFAGSSTFPRRVLVGCACLHHTHIGFIDFQ